jgi:predicted dehydrogenase
VAALGCRVTASLAEAGPLDALLICTPAPVHARAALDAMRDGLDVFVEKPLATSLIDARSVRDAAARSDRVLAVGYNLRFDAGLAALRAALTAGRVGRLLHARLEFGQYLPDWRPGRDYRETVTARAASGGGILLEASHELDVLRWLCGDWSAVSAMVRRLGDLDVDVEDTASAIVEMTGGVIAEVHLDFLRRGYRRTVTCIGTDGTLEWDLRTGTVATAADGSTERLASAADPNDMYVAELRAFLAAAATRTTPAVTADDAVGALELVEAIRSASERGATVRR